MLWKTRQKSFQNSDPADDGNPIPSFHAFTALLMSESRFIARQHVVVRPDVANEDGSPSRSLVGNAGHDPGPQHAWTRRKAWRVGGLLEQGRDCFGSQGVVLVVVAISSFFRIAGAMPIEPRRTVARCLGPSGSAAVFLFRSRVLYKDTHVVYSWGLCRRVEQ